MLKDAERGGRLPRRRVLSGTAGVVLASTAASLPTQALHAIEPNSRRPATPRRHTSPTEGTTALVAPRGVHARRVRGWRSHRLRVWTTGVPRPRRRARGLGGSPGAGAAGVREHQGRTHGRGRQLHGRGEAHLRRVLVRLAGAGGSRRSGTPSWMRHARQRITLVEVRLARTRGVPDRGASTPSPACARDRGRDLRTARPPKTLMMAPG